MVWTHLGHPDIVPLLGVTIDPLQLVLDRMSGEDLGEYIANNPDTDRMGLARVLLLHCAVNLSHRQLKASTTSTIVT